MEPATSKIAKTRHIGRRRRRHPANVGYFQHGLLRPAMEFALLITSLQIGYVTIPISHVVMAPVRRIRRGKCAGTTSPIVTQQR
jgi:hypothetical protein